MTYANYQQVFDVRSFGAVGNNTTDDSAALIAIAALGTGIVYFPPGFVCRCSNNVTFPSTQSLKFDNGAGLSPDSGKTITIQATHESAIIARKDQHIFYGSGSFACSFNEFHLKWFGAKGDGATDDFAAIQAALNALMDTVGPAGYRSGGILYIPEAIYCVGQTLTLLGDYSHTYTIKGGRASANQQYTIIRWIGPPNCTVWQLWGVNSNYLENIGIDGAGHNYQSGVNNAVGSGPLLWYHTSQWGDGPTRSSIGSNASSQGQLHKGCAFYNVFGGLHGAVAFGDGPNSPGSLTYIGGVYTLYACPNGSYSTAITSGSASIACTNSFTAGELVTFSATVGTTGGQVVANNPYYVLSLGLSGTAFKVSSVSGGTPVTFNASGSPTVYLTAATIGINGTCVGTNPASLPTLTSPTTIGASNQNTLFTLSSVTGFVQYQGMIVSLPNQDPWLGHVINISGSVITACDVFGNGPPVAYPAGTTVMPYFPNAVATPIPPGTTISLLNTLVQDSQVAGGNFSECTWNYGLWNTSVPFWQPNYSYASTYNYGQGTVVLPITGGGGYYYHLTGGTSGSSGLTEPTWNAVVGQTTTDGSFTWTCQAYSHNNYTYAQVVIYSADNTEQFGFDRCNISNACYLFLATSPLNNELYFHDVQFGDYSAGAVSLSYLNSTFMSMTQCGCESGVGWGYFLNVNSSCSSTVDGNEIVVQAFGNPNTAAFLINGSSRIVNNQIGNTLSSGVIPFWEPGYTYVAGSLSQVLANPTNGHVFVCTTGGITGLTQPSWNTTNGGTTTDGTVIWTTHASGQNNSSYSYFGVNAQPLSFRLNTGTLDFQGNSIYEENLVPAIMLASGYPAFSGNAGTAPALYAGNRTHGSAGCIAQDITEFSSAIRNITVRRNFGTDINGQNFALPDLEYYPPSYSTLGLIDSRYATTGPFVTTYRASPRRLTTMYSIPYSSLTSGTAVTLASPQAKTIIDGVIVEVPSALTGASSITFDLAVGGTAIVTGASAPSAGNIALDGLAVPTAAAALSWVAGNYLTFTPHFTGTPSAGSFNVYVNHTLFAPLPAPAGGI